MTKRSKSAFAVFSSSFLKGLAAPAYMNDEHSLPEIDNLIEPQIRDRSVGKSLRGDWINIGIDLKITLEKHGQKKIKATTAKSANR